MKRFINRVRRFRIWTLFMKELRQIKADKKLVVAEAMALTEAESKAFWPVYDAYQADISKLNQRTVKLIQDYAASYKSMTDPVAGKLLDEAIAIEKDRAFLFATYRPKFSAVIPATKVARYYQIENKVDAVIRYDLAATIPVVETGSPPAAK